MKKLLLLLSAALLLTGCQRVSAEPSFETAEERLENFMLQNGFVEADDDFLENTLGELPFVLDEEIFISANAKSVSEVGIFRLENASAQKQFKEAVKAYIKTEKEALSELGRLYPAGGLEKELAKYDGVTFFENGSFAAFALTDATNEADITDFLKELFK